MKPAQITAWTLVLAMALALVAPMAMAAPVPSQAACASSTPVDSKAIAAERDLVKAALVQYGLTDKEAGERVGLLTDEEVHSFAADLDSLKAAGAYGGMDTTTVLILVVLVVILLTRD